MSRETKIPEPRRLPSGTYFSQIMVRGKRVSISAPTLEEFYVKATAVKQKMIKEGIW